MASIRDVAKRAGVSTATVSHVLHGREDRVGSDTRRRVLAAIRELKYRPPLYAADGDSRIRTRSIGVLTNDLTSQPLSTNFYYRDALDGIIEVAFFRGFTVHLFVERMWDDIGTAVRRGYDGRCDGLIFIAPPMDSQLARSLQERGLPIVFLGAAPYLPDVSSVDIDNEAAGYALGRHLVNYGHRRILYLGNRADVTSQVEREAGLRRACAEAGLPPDAVQKVPAFGDVSSQVDAALAKDPQPTAFFGWNDDMALMAMNRLLELGYRVPEDFSVVGIDDAPRSVACKPGLTTVVNPVVTLGRRAANLVIDKLLNADQPPETVKFAPDLVLRASTGPARTSARATPARASIARESV